MKHIDLRFCSHVFAVILALVYTCLVDKEGHYLTINALGETYLVDGSWAPFITYMFYWFLLGGIIEFFVDLFRPVVSIVKEKYLN